MTERRQKRDRPALDAEALERLALGYVGRYATSRSVLIRYLSRKLAERGWAGERLPDLDAIAARFAASGYIDEAGLAAARGRSLARRGMGARRVGQALDMLGIASDDRVEALEVAAADAWDTALRFAERKRIGPFAVAPADEGARRRAFAAMMRAGHASHHVRKIIAAEPGIVPLRDD